jgi:hypothetical protein
LHVVLFTVPSSTGCSFEQQLYEDGDEWQPDQCTTCICDGGQVECTQREGCTIGIPEC